MCQMFDWLLLMYSAVYVEVDTKSGQDYQHNFWSGWADDQAEAETAWKPRGLHRGDTHSGDYKCVC